MRGLCSGFVCFFLMIRRPPRSTQSRSSAASDVYKRQVGGKGLFTKELEEALLAGTIDLAVHSMKDLPTELPEGLCVGAVPTRENPYDVLVSREGLALDQLPAGARIGTSSLRRAAQLRAYRTDLEVVPFRGNVDTRLRKVRNAADKLSRLQRFFKVQVVCPSSAQRAGIDSE